MTLVLTVDLDIVKVYVYTKKKQFLSSAHLKYK